MNEINHTSEDTNSPPPKGSLAKGPRNLPAKTPKAARRHRQKQARKRNRGVYSGQ